MDFFDDFPLNERDENFDKFSLEYFDINFCFRIECNKSTAKVMNEKENFIMANTNNDRKIFLAMNSGTSVNNKGEKVPYAFHVEGYVARVNMFRAAEADKSALLSLSVGVGRNPWYLLGPDAVKEQATSTRTIRSLPSRFLAAMQNGCRTSRRAQKSSLAAALRRIRTRRRAGRML